MRCTKYCAVYSFQKENLELKLAKTFDLNRIYHCWKVATCFAIALYWAYLSENLASNIWNTKAGHLDFQKFAFWITKQTVLLNFTDETSRLPLQQCFIYCTVKQSLLLVVNIFVTLHSSDSVSTNRIMKMLKVVY